VHKAADKIAVVKSVIASKEFDVAYQAIVSLEDRAPHHYEALLRMQENGPKMRQFEFVCFAEEVGQITEFDLAMCEKTINRMISAAEWWRRAFRGSEFFRALHRFRGIYRKAARVACRQ
jgi:EAL domain-containing protein (putative c-di-GMP-specific phosphodiesterase class I)